MTRRAPKTIVLLAVAGTLAAGCGTEEEGDPIPADLRAQLDQRLQQAQDRLGNGSAGACRDIESDTELAVNDLLETVPDGVDQDVRNALNEGFARLFEQVSERCDELEAEQTDTETQTTEEAPPADTTETQTETEPETTPTPTEETTPPEQTTPEQPTTPDTGNGDDGAGNGGASDGDGVQVPGGDQDGAATPPGDG
jgi:hypothetical protein